MIERAELGAEIDLEVAFGKGGAHGGSRDVWNGGKRFGA
jgi:hypothetical protein